MSLKTGIETLDRKLKGGVPPGTLIAMIVPPAVQHDQLLCAGTDQHESHYFTTVKSAAAVRRTFDRSPEPSNIETIEEVDVHRAKAQICQRLEKLEAGQDLYLDAIDPIEETLNRTDYIELLNEILQRLEETNTLGYIYGFRVETLPHNRRYTLDFADFVMELRTIRKREEINFQLEIPKANGVALEPRDRIHNLDIGHSVDIDETRNI